LHNTNAQNLKPKTQNSKEPPPLIINEPVSYTHPQITAALLNTRAMHSSIIDLQEIFTHTPHPNIICLTETKHGHIKSTWRNLLKDYKLIHTPSTLDPHTNRRRGGTILGVRRNSYKLIQTVPIPKHIQTYVAAATLEPTKGSTILALSVYMPQHSTNEDKQSYQLVLDWISHLLMIEYPHLTALIGGDMQATPFPSLPRTYYPSLHQFWEKNSSQISQRPYYTNI
jgi:hypothetical protein